MNDEKLEFSGQDLGRLVRFIERRPWQNPLDTLSYWFEEYGASDTEVRRLEQAAREGFEEES